jgi:hypothetical protein
MKSLTLVIGINDYSPIIDDLFNQFINKYEDKIVEFCNITPHTEYQLANFGPGSAWLFESPYKFNLEFEQYNITLTIIDTNT